MSTPAPTHGEYLGEQPSPRPRADLSGAFGPPNRSGGLAGRLARPSRPAPAPRTTETPQPAAAKPAPDVAGEGSGSPDADSTASPVALLEQPPTAPPADQPVDPAPAPSAPTTRPRKTAGAGSGKRAAVAAASPTGATRTDSEGATITSIVYVPGDVLERLRRARSATGLTYTQLALDALDGTHQLLGELVTKATEPVARPAGSLFSGPSSTPATVNAKVQITLRPRTSDAAIIDQLAADHRTSRSQLVTLALDAHLPRA